MLYIYIVRLVHTCTKYWPLRGFENKWKTISSRNQGIIVIILVLKKIQKKHYPNGLMGLYNPLLFGLSQPRIHPNSHDQIALLTFGGTLVVNIVCE